MQILWLGLVLLAIPIILIGLGKYRARKEAQYASHTHNLPSNPPNRR